MKAACFIIALTLTVPASGCVTEKRELPENQGKKAAVTMDQAITEYLENDIIPIPPPPGVKPFVAYDLLGVSENGNKKTAHLLADIRTYGVGVNIL